MKLHIILFALLFSTISFGQEISGQAFYQSKTTVDIDAFAGNREITEDMKKMISERMKNYLEKTYILNFSKDESIYKEEESLETGPMNAGMKMMMGSFTPGIQYKNLKTNEMVEENEFFGKQFLVIDTVPKLDWKLGKESKQIGQYIAFKATAIKKINPNDFSMARPRNRGNRGEKDKSEIQSDSSKIDDPMDMIEIPKELEVTAWYTPQVPVSNGPGEYSGLPGLILELNVYKTTLLCSKIIMNPKQAVKIEAPSKGKEVSRDEYTKIVSEKTKEMRENFRNRGGRRFGG